MPTFTAVHALKTSLILASILLFTSCASLQVYEPKPEVSFTNETNFAGFDTDSKVAWITTVDSNNLYLRLETDYGMSKAKILRRGLHIYFSPSGKKSKDNFIHYPMKVEKREAVTEASKGQSSRSIRSRRSSMEDVIKKLNPHAQYQHGEKTEMFHVQVDTNDFRIDIAEDSNAVMRYTIRIPFSKLVENKEDLNGLSIGIVSGSFDTPVSNRQMPSSRPTNRPTAMGQGGLGTSTPMGTNFTSMAEPIKIWFKIDKVN